MFKEIHWSVTVYTFNHFNRHCMMTVVHLQVILVVDLTLYKQMANNIDLMSFKNLLYSTLIFSDHLNINIYTYVLPLKNLKSYVMGEGVYQLRNWYTPNLFNVKQFRF